MDWEAINGMIHDNNEDLEKTEPDEKQAGRPGVQGEVSGAGFAKPLGGWDKGGEVLIRYCNRYLFHFVAEEYSLFKEEYVFYRSIKCRKAWDICQA